LEPARSVAAETLTPERPASADLIGLYIQSQGCS
jgi:hypothetical protein